MASTQAALYRELAGAGLQLSWSEAELPERERTKHVHRLHPYLGKFVPQLVEALLGRYVRPGGRVLDPFAGSGTTLVQALESGYDVVGVDVAAFNRLLMRVKTARHDPFAVGKELRDVGSRRGASRSDRASTSPGGTRRGRRPSSWCHKHRRTCRPVQEAGKFLARYLADTLDRLEAIQRVRDKKRSARVIHGDARHIRLDGRFDGIVTSPPYPGLIDCHEQHRYAAGCDSSTGSSGTSTAGPDGAPASTSSPS